MRIKQYKHYKRILHALFSSDANFVKLSNRHEGSSLQDAVNRISKMFNDSQNDLKFFVVLDNHKLVGYFATEKLEGLNILSGSFVLPQYRNKKSLTEYWKQIHQFFDGPFYAALPFANEKALSSYKKSGAKILGQFNFNGETCNFLEFKVWQ